MKEPLSNKKCLLQYHFTCPVCGTHGEHAILIYDKDNRRKYGISQLQCMDCFTAWSTIYDKNHNPIGRVIEDRKNDRN